MTKWEIVKLVLTLAPELRTAFGALIKAIMGDDPLEARRAYEAARRAAFAARQK